MSQYAPQQGFGPASADGRFYWDGYQWLLKPPLSPDGHFYWDGNRWVPVRLQSPPGRTSNPVLGWLGVAASWIALVLTVSLLSMPMLFVGGLEIGLPLMLAVAGVVMASWGNLTQRLLSWIPAALAVVVTLLAVAALAVR